MPSERPRRRVSNYGQSGDPNYRTADFAKASASMVSLIIKVLRTSISPVPGKNFINIRLEGIWIVWQCPLLPQALP